MINYNKRQGWLSPEWKIFHWASHNLGGKKCIAWNAMKRCFFQKLKHFRAIFWRVMQWTMKISSSIN